jgi:hypothetical protein
VVEPGQNSVGDLLNNELVIRLPLFSPPENAVGVPFHVFNVALGMLILVIRKFDDEAGSYFLGIHGKETFAIVMPFLNCPHISQKRP